MNDLQIAQVAHKAGFKGNALAVAVAVALAESGGNEKNVGTNRDGSKDRGLWQINNKAHPDVTDALAFSPQAAAAAAYKISKGGKDWSPWVAYKNGAYRKYMVRASAAAFVASGATTGTLLDQVGAVNPVDGLPNIPSASDALGGISGVASALGSLASIATKTAVWIGDPHNWVRVAEVLAGAVAVGIGLHMLARSGAGGAAMAPVRAVDKGVTAVATKTATVAKTAATKQVNAVKQTRAAARKAQASAAKSAKTAAAKSAKITAAKPKPKPKPKPKAATAVESGGTS